MPRISGRRIPPWFVKLNAARKDGKISSAEIKKDVAPFLEMIPRSPNYRSALTKLAAGQDPRATVTAEAKAELKALLGTKLPSDAALLRLAKKIARGDDIQNARRVPASRMPGEIKQTLQWASRASQGFKFEVDGRKYFAVYELTPDFWYLDVANAAGRIITEDSGRT